MAPSVPSTTGTTLHRRTPAMTNNANTSTAKDDYISGDSRLSVPHARSRCHRWRWRPATRPITTTKNPRAARGRTPLAAAEGKHPTTTSVLTPAKVPPHHSSAGASGQGHRGPAERRSKPAERPRRPGSQPAAGRHQRVGAIGTVITVPSPSATIRTISSDPGGHPATAVQGPPWIPDRRPPWASANLRITGTVSTARDHLGAVSLRRFVRSAEVMFCRDGAGDQQAVGVAEEAIIGRRIAQRRRWDRKPSRSRSQPLQEPPSTAPVTRSSQRRRRRVGWWNGVHPRRCDQSPASPDDVRNPPSLRRAWSLSSGGERLLVGKYLR